jgi:dihydrofolate synthase/folylpolyglutamate synthase
LNVSLKNLERLITRDAESFSSREERQAEFDRRPDRTRHLMACLGNPQDSFNLIHIGGTSGKGSVAILCESMLLACGQNVGTHTTPYLQTPLEKARINGGLVGAEEAVSLADEVLKCVARTEQEAPRLGNPHYAEAWLGVALRSFAEARCDIGVIEVGMGGRYDCTNIITPKVSVVTTVHYDHMRVLGDTLTEIASHKAGIIKPGVPAVIGEMHPDALAVMEREARSTGSDLYRLGHEIKVEPIRAGQHGGVFTYRGIHRTLEEIEVGLLGHHQFANAACALAALELYAEQTGLHLDETAMRLGLARARFAGRLEVMQEQPAVVLDGAHNEEKIGALAAAFPHLFGYRRAIMVPGMLEAKSVEMMLGQLAQVTDVMVTTAPDVRGKPAIPSAMLAEKAREAGIADVRDGGKPRDALQQAFELAGPDDLIVVTGSLYLIGAVREHWHTTADIVEQQSMFTRIR